MPLQTTAPIGWNKWNLLNSQFQGTKFPDASFPSVYLPADTAWMQIEIDNCNIPFFGSTADLFNTFTMSGGASFTVTGAAVGAQTVIDILSRAGTATFGIGLKQGAPQIGYCIGNKFKQHIYTRLAIVQDTPPRPAFVYIAMVELLQNSRYKRGYVNHGEVISYSVVNGEHILKLDVDLRTPPPDNVFSNETITITKSNSSSSSVTFTVSAIDIKDDWSLVISDPGTNIPQSGDFYQLNTTWCVEDPYMLSGIYWRGKESEYTNITYDSTLDLYNTDKSVPYVEGDVLGVYIWSNAGSVTLPQPPSFYSMTDSNNSSWAFYAFDPANELKYAENSNTSGDVTTSFIERDVATEENYNKVKDDENTEYFRIDISVGGDYTRNNWHSPCLKGSYLNSNGKYFKIINHHESKIIDVSINSIDNTTKFSPKENTKYKILNHFSWYTNEHYDGIYGSDGSITQRGIFYGSISGSGKNYTISVSFDNYVNWVKNTSVGCLATPLSLVERYKNDISLPSDKKKMYKKYQNWRVVDKSFKEYKIESLVFNGTPTDASQPYTISIVLNESTETLNGFATICFDEGFSSVGNFSKTSYVYTLNGSPKEIDTSGNSTAMCIYGQFSSVPYNLEIPVNTRVGFCGNLNFGVTFRDFNFIYVTTKRIVRGIASFFHALRQEDWLAYSDPSTSKITIRRGSLDFKEYPMKTEIIIGKPSSVVSASTNPVELDVTKDRLTRIQVDLPSLSDGGYTSAKTPPLTTTENGNYIFFSIGDDNLGSTHGFAVSGKGPVDLIALERMGMNSGNVSSDYWTYDENNISPVYIYKKTKYQNLDKNWADIGCSTKDGPIYIHGGASANIYLQYADNKQTIDEFGLFDIIRVSDGENLFIYSKPIGEFSIGDIKNNTAWSNKNVILVAGTSDDSFYWGSPMRNIFSEANNVYPTMVLNSVDYIGCIYNKNNNSLCIFARCYTSSNKYYIGCLLTSTLSLSISQRYLCNPTKPKELNFMWRPPLIKDMTDESKIWTKLDNMIKLPAASTGTSTATTTTPMLPSDLFIRVMGAAELNCNVTNPDEVGITSTAILPDGTYALFYDSEVGVKAIFSSDGGITWGGNNVSYARTGKSGLWIDNSLFFSITTEGIEKANISLGDLQQSSVLARKKKEGLEVAPDEILLQKRIDSEQRFLIGSGVIDYQRISGYITSQGIIKLFYYGEDGVLTSMQSTDGFKWDFTNNF